MRSKALYGCACLWILIGTGCYCFAFARDFYAANKHAVDSLFDGVGL